MKEMISLGGWSVFFRKLMMRKDYNYDELSYWGIF